MISLMWSIAAFATVLCKMSNNVTPSAELLNDVFGNNVDNSLSETGCLDGQICVSHYLCRNSTINKYGAQIISIRIDNPRPCPHYLEKCCNIGDTTNESVITVNETPKGCGFRNVDGVGFRITGNINKEAEYGEFPWMVVVLEEEKTGDLTLNVYQCGGSLLHPKVVLTAAHCVQNKVANALKIRAGEWDTQTKTEVFPHQDRKVAEIVVHERYHQKLLYNDIALLFLHNPVAIEKHVKTICLPPAGTTFDFTRCFATGWGKDVFGLSGKYQDILKKIELPIVPRVECQNRFRTTRLGKNFELHRSFICAGGEKGKDTCIGDGGSPLVCPIPGTQDQYVQAGIVAWGIGCGDEIPGAYADVAGLRPWLDEQLACRNIESSFYTPKDSMRSILRPKIIIS